MNLTPRIIFLAGLVSSISMIAFAISYFQMYKELEPCPLCIMQRIGMFSVAAIFLVATLHNPRRTGTIIYSLLGFIAAAAGGAVSVRHIWLQNLPKEAIPECSPGYDYIVDNFPLMDAIPLLLNGSGECSEILWTFLGLTIPGWTLVGFLFLGLLSLSQLWNKNRR